MPCTQPAARDGGERAAPDQYLTVRVRPGVDEQLTRSYSLSDVPDERGYRISVKREGAGSRYMHERVNVDDLLDVAAPRGSFILREGSRPVVPIGAGVGARGSAAAAFSHGTRTEQRDQRSEVLLVGIM